MIKSRLAFLDPVLLARLRKIRGSLHQDAAENPAAGDAGGRCRRVASAEGRQGQWRPRDWSSPPTTSTNASARTAASTPARIAAVIAEMDADVVAIQEADKRFGRRHGLLDLKALEKQTGLSLIPTSEEANGHGWHGNALLLEKRQGARHAPARSAGRRAARRAGRRPRSARRAAEARRRPSWAVAGAAAAGRCARSSTRSRRARACRPCWSATSTNGGRAESRRCMS